MKKTRQNRITARLLALVATLSFTAAHAQNYPNHPITMIVPFAAGGTSDVIARTVAEQMGTALGQAIVIENVAGAGGSTALARAARAEADGYTIAIGNAGDDRDRKFLRDLFQFRHCAFVPTRGVLLNDRHGITGIDHFRKKDQLGAGILRLR